MCWSFDVSIFSFLIGTIVNISVGYYFKDVPIIKTLCIAWQASVVPIQLYEAIIWYGIDYGQDIMFGSYMATFTVILQVPIMGIIVLSNSTMPSLNKGLATAIICSHIYFGAYSVAINSPIQPIGSLDNECNHLNYAFVVPYVGKTVYFLSSVSLSLLLIRPVDLAIVFLVLCFVGYAFTYSFYTCGEDNGSMWCWISCTLMFHVGLYWKMVKQ